MVAYIATKYAVLRVRFEEKAVTSKRLQLITANGSERLAESDISDEYATFVLAQNQAEASYFDMALATVQQELGITQIQSERLYQMHILQNPEQRLMFTKLI